MNSRRIAYILLVAALVCAISTLLVMSNINTTRLQLQQAKPGAFNYILQSDRAFDRLSQSLHSFGATTTEKDKAHYWEELQRRFDILWSTFKVFDIRDTVNKVRLPSSEKLADDVQRFLAEHDTVFSAKSPPAVEITEAVLLDVRELSSQLHKMGLEVFARTNSFRDGLSTRIDTLYRYFWMFGMLLIVTGTMLVIQLFRLISHSTQLFNEARDSEARLETVVEELRSGKKEQKAKDSFLAAASHDLRQPLHALGLFVSALENKVKFPDGPIILDKIKQSTSALNSLFNSLLDISRLDAGVVEAEPQHFYIDKLFQSLTEEFGEVATERNLAFSVQHESQVACTDYVLFGRILRNLVDNAVVHTREGKVSVSCAQKNEVLIITVADTGPGIPVEEHDSIFSEYYQLNNPERDRSKGLGLGLSIVHRLSDLLDIKVSLTSKPNEGTSFDLYVPAGREYLVTKDDTALDTVTSQVDLRGALILVIDDEKDVRDGMELILTQVNCSVISVESAEAAQQVIVEEDLEPSVIIADYRLREGKTGDDAIALIREELNADIPALIITGDTSPERVREATDSGTRLLHKPVSSAELIAVVESYLLDETESSKKAS